MENRILQNGIYFRQFDEKVEGYDITNDSGDLIHQEYIEPTTLQKMKFKMKYGYSMDTTTIFTSYFYFDSDFNDVYFSTMKGDAITIAGYCKNRKHLGVSKSYLIEGQKATVELDKMRLIISFSDDFKSIIVDNFNFKTKKTIKDGKYYYLDFGII